MNAKKVLGENIKNYRKMRNLTQEELAEKIDISQKHLSSIEIGKKFISADLLEKISATLNVSLSNLFYSPDENAVDDNFLSRVDRVLEDHTAYMKKKIREIK